MRKALHHFKQFFRPYTAARACEEAAAAYVAQACVVDLSAEEKAFVNKETYRMLLRKQARGRRLGSGADWTALLQRMPPRGSAYALHSGR